MMKRIFLLFILLGVVIIGAEETPWKKVRNREGIKVYNRKIDGIEFKEFMAEVEVESSLSSLLAVFLDVENGTQWVENVDEMRDIERVSPYENYTYSYSKAPWPVKDRDAVVHNLITQDSETKTVTILQKGTPEKLEYIAKTVRVEKLQSRWDFIPLNDGNVRVRYQVLTDPGGRLPAWLINRVSVSQPYETLMGLRRMASMEEYQKMDLDHIES